MDIYSKDIETGETRRIGSIPIQKWIMSDEQLAQLTSLSREIANQNDTILSIHIDRDSLSIAFYEKESESDEKDDTR